MSSGMAILVGPSLACILLTGLSAGIPGYRTLASRLIKWRIGVRWYVVAILVAPISTVLIVGALSLFSSEFSPSVFQSDDKANVLILAVVGGLTVAIFEELGWTGFLIPRMLGRNSFFKTGIIVGLIWGYGIFHCSGRSKVLHHFFPAFSYLQNYFPGFLHTEFSWCGYLSKLKVCL